MMHPNDYSRSVPPIDAAMLHQIYGPQCRVCRIINDTCDDCRVQHGLPLRGQEQVVPWRIAGPIMLVIAAIGALAVASV